MSFMRFLPCFTTCLKIQRPCFAGEYTALCAAGVMSFEDGLKLVKLRGEAMQEAATSLPRYDWGMSVVLQCSITVCPAGLCLVGVQNVSESHWKSAWNPWILSASLSILSDLDSLLALVGSRSRSGSKKQLMLSVAGLEKSKLDALCKEAAAKEARQGNWLLDVLDVVNVQRQQEEKLMILCRKMTEDKVSEMV